MSATGTEITSKGLMVMFSSGLVAVMMLFTLTAATENSSLSVAAESGVRLDGVLIQSSS